MKVNKSILKLGYSIIDSTLKLGYNKIIKNRKTKNRLKEGYIKTLEERQREAIPKIGVLNLLELPEDVKAILKETINLIWEAAEKIKQLATLENCALDDATKENMRLWVQWFDIYANQILEALDGEILDRYR